MAISTVNPATGETLRTFEALDEGEIDRRLELDRACRPARQRRGPLLQQATIDQQNELGAIALPGHSCGNRRR